MGVSEFYRHTHFYLMLFLFDDNTCPQFNYKRVYKTKNIMSKNRIKRTNKTLELQAKYYECDDFITFLIEKWQLGYSIISYYLELSVIERYKVIQYLITERPCNSWQNIVLHLLNPNSKRNNGNR